MKLQTAFEWLTVLWNGIKGFFSRLWQAAVQAAKFTWSREAWTVKLAAGFLASAIIVPAAAFMGFVPWSFMMLADVAIGTANLAFLMTGIHTIALTGYRFFVPKVKSTMGINTDPAAAEYHRKKDRAREATMKVVNG